MTCLTLNFILKQTLEDIALVKLVTLLWNHQDIRADIKDFSTSAVLLQEDAAKDVPFLGVFLSNGNQISAKIEKWQMIETKVIEKLPQFEIQASLKDKMEGYIKPIGIQILQWIEYHRRCFDLELVIPSEFYWTTQGTIDKQKTAKMLIDDVHIDIVTRYKLACIYCLVGNIPELLNKLPDDHKIIYHNISDPEELSKMVLLKFWEKFKDTRTCWENMVVTRHDDSHNSCLKALQNAAKMSNKAAIEYFLPTVQQKYLLKIAIQIAREYYSYDCKFSDPPREYRSEVLWSLLSKMNINEQLKMINKCGLKIMSTLLDWPMQSFFVQMVSSMCDIICKKHALHSLLKAILRKVNLGYKDYNYQKIYEDLWQQLPHDYKKDVINDSFLAGIISMLLDIKGMKNIDLMLQYASFAERKSLIFSKTGYIICREIAEHDKWDFLKYFIELCISSKDEMILFKEKVTEFHITEDLLPAKWDKFKQCLDDLVCKFNKRKTDDEGECSTSKRLCTSGSV